jgi:hypothetical protein
MEYQVAWGLEEFILHIPNIIELFCHITHPIWFLKIRVLKSKSEFLKNLILKFFLVDFLDFIDFFGSDVIIF